MDLESNEELTVFDGAIGTEAQKRASGSEDSLTDVFNLTQPEVIKSIHRNYLTAGAQFLTTNTFSSNEIRLSRSGQGEKTEEINEKGARLARQAIENFSQLSGEFMVAGSIGPTGETLVPLGDWTFEQFFETFQAQAEALKRGGVDWIIIETMESLREAKAALVAVNETGLPVITSLSYGDRGRTSYGVVPASGAITLDYLGSDVLGMNCGTGPQAYPEIIKTYNQSTPKPLLAEANAGDPRLKNGETIYDLTPEQYLEDIKPGLPFLSGVGSCCGSNPAFTEALADIAQEYEGRTNPVIEPENEKFITNNTAVVALSSEPEFAVIDLKKEELTSLKGKIVDDKINLLNLSGITRPLQELEKILARQFLQLRSSKPLGIETDDPELLKIFLTATPGISPVRPTGNREALEATAEKYGGLLV